MATQAATASPSGRSVGARGAHVRHGGGARERHSCALAAQEGAGREDARAVAQVDLGDRAVVEDLDAAGLPRIQGDDSRVFTTRSFLNGEGAGVTLSGAASVANVSAARAD